MKLKDDETPVEVVAVLDRSGSMWDIHDDSIGGFNSFLAAQKEIKSPANISVVLFDHQIEVLYDNVDIQHAAPLTKDTYTLRGRTALNDAIGTTMTKVFKKNPSRAIICILTDGVENASREFTSSQVKQMIKEAYSKSWEVVFLATNQDAFATGSTYGISASLTKSFEANSIGTMSAYTAMGSTVSNYRK